MSIRYISTLAAILLAALLISSCDQTTEVAQPPEPVPVSDYSQASEAAKLRTISHHNLKIQAFFEQSYKDMLALSPENMTYRGMDEGKDRWDDRSSAAPAAELALAQEQLSNLNRYPLEMLNAKNALSARLFRLLRQRTVDDYKYRLYTFPVNQMRGVQSQIPAFLINIHRVSKRQDAEDYISRLEKLEGLFDQVIEGLKARAEMGIIVPKFAFPHILNDSENVLSGAPFDASGADSTLFADFKQKVSKLGLEEDDTKALILRAKNALLTSVKPAYEKLTTYVKTLESLAGTDAGVWRLPQGDEFYRNRLKYHTTTELTADEIHALGLAEVERIQTEMRTIMTQVEFTGTLQQFFEFMRTDEQFYYADTDEGRRAYLDKARAVIDSMESRLPELFVSQPKAKLVVKAVEAFREKSAGKAFYQRPAPDGSRPGTYYANLYKMKSMPTYQLEALAYHEGIPGHHLQMAITTELGNVPKFRKYSSFNAYSEGWGLYSEFLPKQIGMYADPYSDFGRLAMELWRACRLVVDTGMHAKKWTREEAIAYLDENTPNAHNDVVKAIERYIVMPGQATAYKIGMIKILELRQRAQNKLGAKYDIKQFHEVVLGNGIVPLEMLEQSVDSWIKERLSRGH